MKRHPGIAEIGVVTTVGNVTEIRGWTLTYCAGRCDCHTPLRIRGSEQHGLLGLAKNRACDCCEPWTADELEAVTRDLVDIATLETA